MKKGREGGKEREGERKRGREGVGRDREGGGREVKINTMSIPFIPTCMV